MLFDNFLLIMLKLYIGPIVHFLGVNPLYIVLATLQSFSTCIKVNIVMLSITIKVQKAPTKVQPLVYRQRKN